MAASAALVAECWLVKDSKFHFEFDTIDGQLLLLLLLLLLLSLAWQQQTNDNDNGDYNILVTRALAKRSTILVVAWYVPSRRLNIAVVDVADAIEEQLVCS